MSRPRLLDLFCGAGGAAMGYANAGFDVYGVDINPQPNYPFQFTQWDALEYPIENDRWDAIHASPPCPAYSALRTMANASEHPMLIDPIRDLLDATGLPWVIENVVGAPMQQGPMSLFGHCGITLCGTMFGLNNGEFELQRHRRFESNIHLEQPDCAHSLPCLGFYGDHVRMYDHEAKKAGRHGTIDITGNARKMPLVRDLLGIDWMTWDEAKLAIPPAFTRFIGEQLMAVLGESCPG